MESDRVVIRLKNLNTLNSLHTYVDDDDGICNEEEDDGDDEKTTH